MSQEDWDIFAIITMGAFKRKFVPSTESSEEYNHETGVCSIEYYMAHKDPFRVAPRHKYAVPWLYNETGASDDAAKLVESIEDNYRKILEDSDISFERSMVRKLYLWG